MIWKHRVIHKKLSGQGRLLKMARRNQRFNISWNSVGHLKAWIKRFNISSRRTNFTNYKQFIFVGTRNERRRSESFIHFFFVFFSFRNSIFEISLLLNRFANGEALQNSEISRFENDRNSFLRYFKRDFVVSVFSRFRCKTNKAATIYEITIS